MDNLEMIFNILYNKNKVYWNNTRIKYINQLKIYKLLIKNIQIINKLYYNQKIIYFSIKNVLMNFNLRLQQRMTKRKIINQKFKN